MRAANPLLGFDFLSGTRGESMTLKPELFPVPGHHLPFDFLSVERVETIPR